MAQITVMDTEQTNRRHIETAHRPVVMGMHGAVTCGHPLGSVAGLRILENGGNAVDAIVGMAAAVGVVEPNMSGVGGDGFTLVYERSSGRVYAINATGPAPQAATLDAYADGIPRRGPRSASVPGAVSGWALMHERFGSQEFSQVLQPAVGYAREGFPVSHNLALDLHAMAPVFSQFDFSARTFLAGGCARSAGQLLCQPELADTLEEIAATNGEALYHGNIAERLVNGVQRDGGILDLESLGAFQAEIVEPLSASYRGYTVYEPAPNCSGHVLLQELLMAGEYDLALWKNPSPALIHHLVEMKKLAFEDRDKYAADPATIGTFPDHLLSSAYARQRLELLNADRAATRPGRDSGPGDTTYLAATDRDGNMASMTTSINMSFGSGYIAGDTGILLNNRMTYWNLEPDHPNVLRPGKRVRHTVSPALLLKDDEPVIAIGTPGADGQVQTVFQVLVNIIDYGMNLQQAVEHPRWRSYVDGQDANWPHRHANELQIEGRMPAQVIEGLQARGHQIVRLEPWSMGVGSVQVIQRTSDGILAVGSDPRRDAYGLAF